MPYGLVAPATGWISGGVPIPDPEHNYIATYPNSGGGGGQRTFNVGLGAPDPTRMIAVCAITGAGGVHVRDVKLDGANERLKLEVRSGEIMNGMHLFDKPTGTSGQVTVNVTTGTSNGVIIDVYRCVGVNPVPYHTVQKVGHWGDINRKAGGFIIVTRNAWTSGAGPLFTQWNIPKRSDQNSGFNCYISTASTANSVDQTAFRVMSNDYSRAGFTAMSFEPL